MTQDNSEKIPTIDSTKVFDAVMAKSEEEMFQPEEVTLPSCGAYYDGKIPDGVVTVFPMRMLTERALATARLSRGGKAMDLIFKHCIKFPNQFDHLDLLIGDRMFLLYYIRGITYGADYEFVVKCPNPDCGTSNVCSYDLTKLSSTIRKPKSNLGQEPFKLVLPYMSKVAGQEFWVKLRFLRGYDMQAMLMSRTSKRNIGQTDESLDETVAQNLSMAIVEAMGVTDRSKINALVSKLHSGDSACIRSFLDNESPGIDSKINLTCKECGQDIEIELPITDTFFRPAHARRM